MRVRVQHATKRLGRVHESVHLRGRHRRELARLPKDDGLLPDHAAGEQGVPLCTERVAA